MKNCMVCYCNCMYRCINVYRCVSRYLGIYKVIEANVNREIWIVCMLVHELFLLKKDLSFLGISWRTIIYRKYDKFHVKIQPERIYVRELSEGTFRALYFALLRLIFFYFFFFFIRYLAVHVRLFSYYFFFFILW